MSLARTTTHENRAFQRSVGESLVQQNAALHMFSRIMPLPGLCRVGGEVPWNPRHSDAAGRHN